MHMSLDKNRKTTYLTFLINNLSPLTSVQQLRKEKQIYVKSFTYFHFHLGLVGPGGY